MSSEMEQENVSATDYWASKAANALVGRKIVAVRYLNDLEVSRLGWDSRSVVIEFDNGHIMWPSRDDEGNDAGALFCTDYRVGLIPAIDNRVCWLQQD